MTVEKKIKPSLPLATKKADAIRAMIFTEMNYHFSCLTISELGEELTQYAVDKGYTPARQAVYGRTVQEWGRKQRAPWWAVKSALEILLLDGWSPSRPEGWLIFSHCWLQANGPFNTLPEILIALPPQIDRAAASEQFLEVQERWLISENTNPVHRVVDRDGAPLGSKFIGPDYAIRDFLSSSGLSSWDEAKKRGFDLDSTHKRVADLLTDEALDPVSRDHLAKRIGET